MLSTPRLILRPMREDDIDALLGVFGDPKVMDAFASDPFDVVHMEHWVRRNLEHQEEHGFGLFTVVLRESGLVIGDCGLELMEVDDEPVAELGYDLRSDVWGQGLATEAARAVRDHAFESLGLPRLISLVRVGNAASWRVAEKIGMRLERELDRGGVRYWQLGMRRLEGGGLGARLDAPPAP